MESAKCPSCGTPLGAGTLAGQCPRCLLAGDSRAAASTEDADAQHHAAAVAVLHDVGAETLPDHDTEAIASNAPPSPQVPLHHDTDAFDDADVNRHPDVAASWSDRAPAPRIEGYEVLRELKQGGQGVVYLAVQRSTKRKVAVKVLLAGMFASKSARRRFEREIELVAGLKHPNIIAVFDSGTTPDGHDFYVMDYVRGVPLTQYVRDKGLGLEQVLALFATVCDAVNHAHLRGVIHRDLKPSNILVDAEGNVRVLDFGLAKALIEPAESIVSVTGNVVGTFPYMSPEQTRANPDEMDTRTDVYALGVVLYEALTGTHPYPVTGNVADVVRHIVETPPGAPARNWTGERGVRGGSGRHGRRRRGGRCPIDSDLETMLLKALAKERERRYDNAGHFARDVRRYLADEPIVARRPSAAYQLKMFSRRHRALVVASVGIFLGLVVGVIATTWVALQLRAANADLVGANEAVVTFMAFGGDDLAERGDLIGARRLYMKALDEASGRDLAGSAILAGLAEIGSRDGGQVPLMGTYGRDGGPGGFVGHAAQPQNVAVLRTRRMALTSGFDGKLILWDLGTGRMVKQVDSGHGRINYVAVAPDEQWAATAGEDGTVRTWDLNTFAERGPRLVLDQPRPTKDKPNPRADGAWMVTISDDGNRVLAGAAGGRIYVWDQAGNRKTIGECEESAAALAFVPGDSRYAFSGDHSGAIRLWDLDQGQPLGKELARHGPGVNSIAFSRDGGSLVSGSFDSTLVVWEVRGKGSDRVLVRKRQPIPVGAKVWRTAFSPDGGSVAAGCADGRVAVADPTTGSQLHVFRGQKGTAMGVEFLDDRTLVSTGDEDKDERNELVNSALMVWDATCPAQVTGAVKQLSVDDSGLVSIVTASGPAPDKYIGRDGALHERRAGGRSAAPWEPLSSTKEGMASANWARGRKSGATSAAGNPMGEGPAALARVATGDALIVPDNQTFQLWARPLARPGKASGPAVAMRRFQGHRGRVTAAAFSDNGRYMVSADDTGMVLAWDLFRPLRGHQLELKVRAAREVLSKNPSDPDALATLKEWFEFRGRELAGR